MKQVHLHLPPRRDYWNTGSVRSSFVSFQMLLMTDLISALSKKWWYFIILFASNETITSTPLPDFCVDEKMKIFHHVVLKRWNNYIYTSSRRRDFWNIGSVRSSFVSFQMLLMTDLISALSKKWWYFIILFASNETITSTPLPDFCVDEKMKIFHHVVLKRWNNYIYTSSRRRDFWNIGSCPQSRLLFQMLFMTGSISATTLITYTHIKIYLYQQSSLHKYIYTYIYIYIHIYI